MSVWISKGRLGSSFVLAMTLAAVRSLAADRVELKEDAAGGRILEVAADVDVSGKLYPQPGADKALKLAVEARFRYAERVLPATGREAESLRSVRLYSEARASIEAGEQISNATLRPAVRLIVAQGQADGLELFSPSGPLTYGELELVRIPGDTLAVLALLPASAVETGESWKAPGWSLPLLSGQEAIEKGELTVKLESIESDTARISFAGEVTGAALGAPSVVGIEGHLLFDLEQKLVKGIELSQTEKRSIGAVSPGLDVTAKSTVQRAPASRPVRLSDKDLAQVPLEPNPASRLLTFEAPAWNLRFYHDRRWHLFHQTAETAVLRLLDKGGLIAQCNIKKLVDAGRGEQIGRAHV